MLFGTQRSSGRAQRRFNHCVGSNKCATVDGRAVFTHWWIATNQAETVARVSVVANANGKNSQPIKHDTDHDGQPDDLGPEHRNAGEMRQHERIADGHMMSSCSSSVPLDLGESS
jgi:hypothetical protein